MKKRTRVAIVGALAVLSLLAAACGDDDDTTTEAPSGNGGGNGGENGGGNGAETCTQEITDEQMSLVDANGDGTLTIAVATPGSRDDGGYYQALVECVERLTDRNGGEAIIVDQIPAADAATQIENLAKQGPDIMMIGASEIGQSLPDLAAKYSDIFWYCNCGAGTQPDPNFAQSNDDGSEINFTAGYATGLLLKDAGKSSVAFIGNNNFNFEVESYEAFKLGLQEVDPSFEVDYYATGSFEDVQAATEAYNTAKGQGVGAVYPFLGGALEPIVKLANNDDIITMSAGKSDVCDDSGGLEYQIAVRFDAGDYLDTIFTEILTGEFKEGDVRTFHVGQDPEPGAIICDPTDEQQAAMDEVYRRVGSGELDDAFFEIKKKAYNF